MFIISGILSNLIDQRSKVSRLNCYIKRECSHNDEVLIYAMTTYTKKVGNLKYIVH